MVQFLPITDIYAREIWDSRGMMTIEVEVVAGENCYGKAQVSSDDTMWSQRAVSDINDKIARELMDMNVFEQEEIDRVLDKLYAGRGTHALIGVSTAVGRCASAAAGLPFYRYLGGLDREELPVPILKIGEGMEICPVKGQGVRRIVERFVEIHREMSEVSKKDWTILCEKYEKEFTLQKNPEIIVIKPFVEGTLTKVLNQIRKVKQSGKNVRLMHAEGETEDTAIVDLAVAFACEQIDMGSPEHLEGIAKYNRLLRIEEELVDRLKD